MTFETIMAQDSAIDTLKRALISGKVHHAYLFSGPPGVGKQMLAYALAKALNCTEQPTNACGHCSNCRKIDRGVHPDVFKVTLPETRKTIPVESIRELEGRLALRPHEGKSKVAIIDPADKMTEAAANALLKTLEEPGPQRFLILITDRLSTLLQTVRSRCQLVRLNALPQETVRLILEKNGCAKDAAHTAAALARGSVSRALSYLEDEVVERVTNIINFIYATTDQTPIYGIEIIESFKLGKRKIRDEAIAFLELAPTVLSEILWLRTHGIDGSKERPLVQRFGEKLTILAGRLSPSRIAALTFALHHAEQSMLNNNMNPQLAFEGVLAEMRSPFQTLNAGSGFTRS